MVWKRKYVTPKRTEARTAESCQINHQVLWAPLKKKLDNWLNSSSCGNLSGQYWIPSHPEYQNSILRHSKWYEISGHCWIVGHCWSFSYLFCLIWISNVDFFVFYYNFRLKYWGQLQVGNWHKNCHFDDAQVHLRYLKTIVRNNS